GIGSDSRIGSKFLYPGCGYGGSCFPKDVKALIKTAEKEGYSMQVLKAVEEVNDYQKSVVFKKLKSYYKGDLKGKKIAIWGLAFKPETDDMREATSLVTIKMLLEEGCTVSVYDPVSMAECKRRIGDVVNYATDMYDATLDCDALLILTEWRQFRLPSWGVLHKSMNEALIIDGRNIYDADEIKELGFDYYCIGR
ncbi:MAG: UDP binding domain-containing protein, partial [Rikenellaceae bacterium]